MLSRDMERYVALQRAAGLKFDTQHRALKSFAAFAEAAGDRFVRAERVCEWAVLRPSARRQRTLLLTVRRFALTMQAEDTRHEAPAADAVGRATRERRVPYIYTTDEIARLIHAASRMAPRRSAVPLMYATLFGLLAVTGLRISEALALRCDDVTEDGLIIRKSKLGKSRIVPLHGTTRRALDQYLSVRQKLGAFDRSLFVSASGGPLPYDTARGVFRRLLRSVGVQKKDCRPAPRIHDLRHTFAVRSLERCEHDRDAVARHMPALSTYLGHAHVTDTYWYLQATPVLLKQIAQAGEALHRRGVS
jgi:integrase